MIMSACRRYLLMKFAIDEAEQRKNPRNQWQFESNAHAECQHHHVVDIRIERQHCGDIFADIIGRKKTYGEGSIP